MIVGLICKLDPLLYSRLFQESAVSGGSRGCVEVCGNERSVLFRGLYNIYPVGLANAPPVEGSLVGLGLD